MQIGPRQRLGPQLRLHLQGRGLDGPAFIQLPQPQRTAEQQGQRQPKSQRQGDDAAQALLAAARGQPGSAQQQPQAGGQRHQGCGPEGRQKANATNHRRQQHQHPQTAPQPRHGL